MKAYLSSLGMMGRRHLLGLVQAGCDVTGFDPSQESFDKSKAALSEAGLDPAKLTWAKTVPREPFDVAVFSETANYRTGNFRDFLEGSTARRVLLEKPLGQSPADLNTYSDLLKRKNIDPANVQVNFARRTWKFNHMVKELASKSKQVDVQLQAGSIGLACNGVHFLDLFEFYFPDTATTVESSDVPGRLVDSGRGVNFKDYGTRAMIRKGPHSFALQLSSESSAGGIYSIRGDDFMIWCDEMDFTFRVWQRNSDSKLPLYRTGSDYKLIQEGKVDLIPLPEVTRLWLETPAILPSFNESLKAHRVMFEILEKGGQKGPYHFT